MGLETLTDGQLAFINCTEDSLVSGYMQLFPAAQVVLEVLESVAATPAVVEACQELKKKGYVIALDDFVDDGTRAELVNCADILKIDLRAVSLPECVGLIRKYAGRHR